MRPALGRLTCCWRNTGGGGESDSAVRAGDEDGFDGLGGGGHGVFSLKSECEFIFIYSIEFAV